MEIKMGKYDIDAKFVENSKINMSDLVREIMDETDSMSEESTIRKCLETYVNQLDQNLNLNIKDCLKETNTKEKFDALKIIKLIYRFNMKYPKKIIKILANPSMENVKKEYSEKSEYGDIINDLYEVVKKQVDKAEEMETIMNEIHLQWHAYIDRITTFPISYYYDQNKDVEYQDIKEMIVFFRNCLIYLKKNRNISKSNEEGIMRKFFAFLLTHRFLCEDVELDKLDEINLDEFNIPTEEYVDKYKKYFGIMYKKKDLIQIEEYLECPKENVNSTKKTVVELIFEGNGKKICFEETQRYKYVLKKIEKVIKWLIVYKNFLGADNKKTIFIIGMYILTYGITEIEKGIILDEDKLRNIEKMFKNYTNILSPYIFKDAVHKTGLCDSDWGISADLLIAIIQEVYYITYEKGEEIIPNKYYGYNNKGQTLTAVLKNQKDDLNHTITILALIKQIEMRYLANLGYAKVLEEKRVLHEVLLKLKMRLYYYDNWNDYMGENLFLVNLLKYVTDRFKYKAQVENNHEGD